MTQVHVLRVFVNEDGEHGNPLGVILNTSNFSDDQRQSIATELGFSETVFVDDVENATLRIFTPACELPLAGHPLVGTAWLLARFRGEPVDVLRPVQASPVETWKSETTLDTFWIRAKVADAPPIDFVELETSEEVETMSVPPNPPHDHDLFWAWQDRTKGLVRARFFAPAFGIEEDEATGGAALVLVSKLNRPVTITQGHGSVILAEPDVGGYARVGGQVVEEPSIDLDY